MAEQDPQNPPQQQDPPAQGQPQQQPPQSQPQEQHVPYARFKEVNDQLKALKDQIAALTGEKREKETAAKTLEDRLAALEKERADAAAENMRLKVAGAKKLPPDLADRLRGATAQELEADADRLLSFLKPADGPGVPPPGGGGRAPKLDLGSMTPAQIRKARAEGKI
jgi:predicted RNase H-like nuclease (RuvC/YqgF family)